MSALPTAWRWRLVGVLSAVSILLYLLVLSSDDVLPAAPYEKAGGRFRSAPGKPRRIPEETLRSLSLTEEQCNATFPRLTEDIDRTVALGPFALRQATGDMGPLQARIQDGNLYIVNWEPRGTLSPQLLESRTASLHQIYRALVTSPEPLPDTVFALNVQDQPFGTAWSYARPAYAAPTVNMPALVRAFLMPHFSFWGWPLPFVGSVDRAARAIDRLEAALPFRAKDPRAVWRGTARFNSVHHPRLRLELLRKTRGADWADVQELTWKADEGGDNATTEAAAAAAAATTTATRAPDPRDPDGYESARNSLLVEDFCRYKYVLHTEGVTYSGRFQFLQMCASVLLTPPIAWLQHTTHLVRPLFSCDLDLDLDLDLEEAPRDASGQQQPRRRRRRQASPSSWTPSADVQKGWPRRYAADEANLIFVAPDWSDLEATVRWLERNPQVAEGIARRQRDLFVGGGYFSPAAEACYWRALIRGWSRVARTEGEGWEEKEGVRWELFSMGHDP